MNNLTKAVIGFAIGTLFTQQVAALPFPVLVGAGNPENSGYATEEAWAQEKIDIFNSIPGVPDLPQLPEESMKTELQGGKTFSFSAPEDCDFVYLLLKWGGGKRAPVDTTLFYMEGGDSWKFHSPSGKGLSHFIVWCGGTNVPDGGTTVALLGLGLAAVGLIRRRV